MKNLFHTITFRPRAAISLALLILSLALLTLAGCTSPGTATTQPDSMTSPTTQPDSTTSPTTQPAASIQLISPAAAKEMLANNPDVLLLDVRTPEEYAAGYIAGSQLLPYEQIEARADELPADKATPIIVYCRSGRRSAIAAESLASLGYTEIYDLGGIQDWPYDIVK